LKPELIVTLRTILIIPAAILGWLTALFLSLRLDYYRTVLFFPEGVLAGSECYLDSWDRLPLWFLEPLRLELWLI